MTQPAGEVLVQARRLLDTGAPVDPGTDPLALAWALKDLCYEAWSSEPPRAARAAEAVQALLDGGPPAAQRQEIEGLSAWTRGIACLTRGDMAAAVSDFDAAATAFRAAERPDPAAQTQVPKIMALSMLGQHDAATACAEAAQRELLALGNVGAAARVSLNLANLLAHRDGYAAAARHFGEAAVLFARLGDRTYSVMADIGRGAMLGALGDFEDATRLFARAQMRAASGGMELQLAMAEEWLALMELTRGRFREALSGMEAARRRYEGLSLPQHLAIAEKQLADTYLELRLLPEALGLFQAAVTKFEGLQLPVEQAWALTQRGRTEALLGQPQADRSFSAAAALFGGQHNAVGAAAVAQARAELALVQGRPAEAVALALQAAQGFGAAGHAEGRARGEVVHAQALLAQGDVSGARAGFDAALERARALQQVQVQVRCLTGLGLAAQAAGDAAEARLRFEAAIELFEEQRRVLPGDELRSAFLTDHLRPYQERLRQALAEASEDEGGEVLLQLDRFRARSLDDRLADEGAATEADDQLQGLRERLNWLYRRVQRLQDEGRPTAALSEDLQHTERELLEQARRQRLSAPVSAVAADAFTIAGLQDALQPGEALVAYGALDDELFACVATSTQVRLVRHVAHWPAVLEAVRAVRFQIETLRHGAAPVQAHLPVLAARATARLAQVQALVWQPLRAALEGRRRVLVVPHAQLGSLPFAAVVDARPAEGQASELAVVPSARAALRGIRRPPVAAQRAVVLGESTRLPHAADEAAYVASLFPAGESFVADQATVSQLRAHAPQADVLHLACHAQFRSDNPRFSALHLHDGAFTVEQAEQLNLRPCTVVLSACETALAQTSSGDEMVGLVRAFLMAGASRVLASLWPVDDAVTRSFMADFYGSLSAGDGPAAALRFAQSQCRASHPHPYFWSAFTLFGGW